MENEGFLEGNLSDRPTQSTSYIKPIILREDNYLTWKTLFANEMHRNKIFYMLDGSYDASTETMRIKEQGVIVCSKNSSFPLLEKDILDFMRGRMSDEIKASLPTDSFASSRSLWTALEKKFATQSKAFLKQLRTEFRLMRHGTPSIARYLQKVDEIVNGLEAIGKYIPKEDLVIEVLAGLGPEYEFELADNNPFEHSYEKVTEMLSDQKTKIDSKTLLHCQPILLPRDET